MYFNVPMFLLVIFFPSEGSQYRDVFDCFRAVSSLMYFAVVLFQSSQYSDTFYCFSVRGQVDCCTVSGLSVQ